MRHTHNSTLRNRHQHYDILNNNNDTSTLKHYSENCMRTRSKSFKIDATTHCIVIVPISEFYYLQIFCLIFWCCKEFCCKHQTNMRHTVLKSIKPFNSVFRTTRTSCHKYTTYMKLCELNFHLAGLYIYIYIYIYINNIYIYIY